VLAGFSFGHQIKATTAITSPASGDFAKHRSKIEGYRIARWGFGATGAAQIVVAFQYYSTGAGVAFVKLSNSDQSRCFYHEITVAAGWNFYAFLVPGDTTGTWQATTSAGLVFEVFSSGKETTPQSSLDAWGATSKVQTTNSVNLLDTNNDLTIVTGVYIAAGNVLPAAADLLMLMRPFDVEYDLCLRYYWKVPVTGDTQPTGFLGGCNGTTAAEFIAIFPVQMRTSPSMAVSDVAHFGVVPATFGSNSTGTGLALQGQAAPGKTARISLSGTSGLTSGSIAFLYSANASATMAFSARL
jgi:hypothetical protein